MFFDVYNNVKLGDHCAPNEVNTQAILAVMNDVIPYQISVPYYLKVSMPDGPGATCDMIQCCFDFLTFCYDRNLHILVHCWSGKSRSVSVISGWLHTITKRPFEEIVKEILQKRVCFEQNPPESYFPINSVVFNTTKFYLDALGEK